MALESVELIKDILTKGWNRGNTNQRTPIIEDITTVEAGRGKRFDLTNKDAIYLYETVHNEEQPEVFYDFVHTRINITVDARTMNGRKHLMKMEDEIRRVVHSKRKGDAENFDRLLYKMRTDLSDRTKRLHRMTFQVEIVIFSELIA
ncbi:MAG: hypothetical protein CL581_09260 [Alteromonadaceae bacterium]|uniref:hypothetical protein n=1 Tax=Phenylobacterium sp. TaxID=1871053 RepID=UPI000C50EFE2|nr:hypothetical protein [Phenylobacterium sp.]MAA64948.1 hypothetical protein [Alteromonadaceae bacterium]MAK81411.1 hypothetical protein [Phenylobacterium sp.]